MPQMAPILSTSILYTIVVTLILLSSIIYFSNCLSSGGTQSNKNFIKPLTWMW